MPNTEHGCYVIAEAGVNHNGDPAMAFQLVDAAVDAGADAVKFQMFRAEDLVVPGAARADYQKQQTGEGDQLSLLKTLELDEQTHRALFDYCSSKGIDFLSTPFGIEQADFLINLGLKYLKLPSGELTNHPLLVHCAQSGLPLILSTGMADMQEVIAAVALIRQHSRRPVDQNRQLTLLHCTSNYPTAMEDVNLAAMGSLHRETGLAVGYSDHTDGIQVASLATACGASVIEKHFTLDRTLPGPDHQASLEPDQLAEMIAQIRATEIIMGDGIKRPRPGELPVRDLVRRSLVLSRNMEAGEALTETDIVLRRPGNGMAPNRLDEILGRRLSLSHPAGHVLREEDLQACDA